LSGFLFHEPCWPMKAPLAKRSPNRAPSEKVIPSGATCEPSA
jgi:hypothetical protein